MANKLFSSEVRHIIYATPEKVFDALTKKSIMKKWIEGDIEFELKLEGRVSLFDGWVKGSVLAFEKGKMLSYTWKPKEWDKKTAPSIVEFTLKSNKAGTEVVIKHYDFPSQQDAESHKEGWINYVLYPLNDYFISLMD
jgi:uncharacterized protein YndB with AHSA1/START domain